MIAVAKAFLLGLAVFAGHQGGVLLWEGAQRTARYSAARDYAEGRGKPLLVVGGPWGTSPFRTLFRVPGHGCGDICLDLNPQACAGCQFVEGDIRSIPFPDKFMGAAFASHVLEHLPTVADAEQAVAELHRVADGVWVAYPSRQSLMARLHPGHHLWVAEQDGYITFEQRGIPAAGVRCRCEGPTEGTIQ